MAPNYPEEWEVTVMVTSHHRIKVRPPQDLRGVGDSASMDAVRRMAPEDIRRRSEPVGTTAYVVAARPLENVTPQ